MTAPAPPRRGRPKVPGLEGRRREEILAAATHEFARRGFPGTDLQTVANQIGIGKGTVYRYFRSKEALFLAAADRGMRLLQESSDREAAKGKDAVDRIVRATHAYLRFFDAHPEFVELIVQERAEFKDRKRPTYFAHRDVNIRPWNKLLQNLVDEGELRKIPVGRITDVFSGVLYGAIFTNYFENRRRSPERQAEDILDVIFRGILGPRLLQDPLKKGAVQ
ncbi:MAG TPA: TetR/AcrR family transcriptional regulator [Planctomycetota bacterium]|nr:TetR/AcrR family transcriptional regulator [Planctomycetota bacterium]